MIYRVSNLTIMAWFVVAFLLISSVEIAWANPFSEDAFQKIANKLKDMDPDNQIPPAVEALRDANCGVDAALAELFKGNLDNFISTIKINSEAFERAARTLRDLANQDSLQEPLTAFERSMLNLTNLFPVSPQVEGDILNRISELAEEASAAGSRIVQGNGSDADLTKIVQNSSDISRLVALLFQILAQA